MQIAALALLSARRGLAATRITPSHSGETMSPMLSWSASDVVDRHAHRRDAVAEPVSLLWPS
jgi:hypothetical protein